MFAYIVGGPLDPVAAGFALLAMAGMITIIVTSMIVKRRSRREIEVEFELAKIKLRNEDVQKERQIKNERDFELGKIAANREIEFKKIDSSIGLKDVTPGEPRFDPR